MSTPAPNPTFKPNAWSGKSILIVGKLVSTCFCLFVEECGWSEEGWLIWGLLACFFSCWW
jgi:hypothetical protein